MAKTNETTPERKKLDKSEWNKLEVGGLWKRRSEKGTPYLFGKLEFDDQKFLIRAFKNKFKTDAENDNTPDYRAYLIPDEKPKGPVKKVVPPVVEDDVEVASTGEEDL